MMTGLIREIRGVPPRMERRVATSRIRRTGMSLIVAALAATAFNVSTAMARHQWSNYHWEFPSGLSQLTIYVNNCQDGTALQQDETLLYDYDIVDHFSGPNDDWDGVINGPDRRYRSSGRFLPNRSEYDIGSHRVVRLAGHGV